MKQGHHRIGGIELQRQRAFGDEPCAQLPLIEQPLQLVCHRLGTVSVVQPPMQRSSMPASRWARTKLGPEGGISSAPCSNSCPAQASDPQALGDQRPLVEQAAEFGRHGFECPVARLQRAGVEQLAVQAHQRRGPDLQAGHVDPQHQLAGLRGDRCQRALRRRLGACYAACGGLGLHRLQRLLRLGHLVSVGQRGTEVGGQPQRQREVTGLGRLLFGRLQPPERLTPVAGLLSSDAGQQQPGPRPGRPHHPGCGRRPSRPDQISASWMRRATTGSSR